MEHTSRQQSVFQKLMQADTALDLAMVHFMEQYVQWLIAVKRNRGIHPAIGTGITNLLLSLSTIQNIQLQKNKMYASLLGNESRHYMSVRLRKTGTALEPRIHRLLHPFKTLIADFDPGMFPSALYYLSEIHRYYAKKKKLFPRANSPSSAPWINPSMKIISC
ncbi:hypothetical protein ACFQI7_14430 [Paenibacillus allorhizosphaerae]|uniref:Uncharacterized protein n=1 Tax=Paenibacillus allorhizosphaerae TaxID=2849866 RepID=A0ABN7THL1_9BACL|nr:hypothetical protein [Paenibacillus allorhizosphaerae]CAG7626583.1 hypothetical protein PAECIP111802_01265 [Paenibacillus allorhizosphaerae]